MSKGEARVRNVEHCMIVMRFLSGASYKCRNWPICDGQVIFIKEKAMKCIKFELGFR